MKLFQSKIFALIAGIAIAAQLLVACAPAISAPIQESTQQTHSHDAPDSTVLNSAESAPEIDS